jgi:hypothetical protein
MSYLYLSNLTAIEVNLKIKKLQRYAIVRRTFGPLNNAEQLDASPLMIWLFGENSCLLELT